MRKGTNNVKKSNSKPNEKQFYPTLYILYILQPIRIWLVVLSQFDASGSCIFELVFCVISTSSTFYKKHKQLVFFYLVLFFKYTTLLSPTIDCVSSPALGSVALNYEYMVRCSVRYLINPFEAYWVLYVKLLVIN